MKRVIKKVFYPHKKHNPRPLFWHPLSVSVFAFGVLFISGFLTLQKIETTNPHALLGDIRSGALISFTNKARTHAGLPALIENEILAKAAQLKAQDMAEGGYFAHYSPTGLSPWFWFTQAGYDYQKAGENLAVNFEDSKDVVNAWMNSPTHKANIIKDGYTEIGIASAEGMYKGKEATFVVQLFATPKIEEATGLALAIEKNSPIPLGEQSLVRGAEISVYALANIFQIFSNQTYTLIVLLALLSFIIICAISILFIKSKHPHAKQFYLSLTILLIVLCMSILTEVSFFRDISISANSI